MLTWTQDVSDGLTEIHGQHGELFGYVDAWRDACRKGEGKEQIAVVVSFLEKDAEIHFSTEDKYMCLYDFPKLEIHTAEHEYLASRVWWLREQLDKDGTTELLVDRVSQVLNDWVNHVKGIDTEDLEAAIQEALLSERVHVSAVKQSLDRHQE